MTDARLDHVRSQLAEFRAAGLLVTLDERGCPTWSGERPSAGALSWLAINDAQIRAVLTYDALSDAERDRLRAVLHWRHRAGLSTEAER